ncbi:MAG: hypothetical protein LBF22_10630 [Deltaproteobacteria bacterium]|jgi:hypothetical protein|nr:hypothetical protein [Deltaproteobacteria bacterium]
MKLLASLKELTQILQLSENVASLGLRFTKFVKLRLINVCQYRTQGVVMGRTGERPLL